MLQDKAPTQAEPLQDEVTSLRHQVITLRRALEAITEELDRTIEHHSKSKGGQTVTPSGDFLNVAPSVVWKFKWWSKWFHEILSLPEGNVTRQVAARNKEYATRRCAIGVQGDRFLRRGGLDMYDIDTQYGYGDASETQEAYSREYGYGDKPSSEQDAAAQTSGAAADSEGD